MIKPEIQMLIDARTPITPALMDKLRCNSYEWEALIPLMTDEALLRVAEHALKNCSIVRRPAATYNEAVIAVLAPELVRRLRPRVL